MRQFAAYREILKRPPLGSLSRIEHLERLAALDAEAIAALAEFVEQKKGAPPEIQGRGRLSLGKVHAAAKQHDEALKALNEVVAGKNIPAELVEEALLATADVHRAQDHAAQAVAAYRTLLQMRTLTAARRLDVIGRLLATDPEANVLREVATYLDNLSDHGPLRVRPWPEAAALRLAGIPENDAVWIGLLPADQVVEQFKQASRRRTGRVDTKKLAALTEQLEKGGEARPFVVSNRAKELAAELPANSPLGKYFKALLAGDYPQAAAIAWHAAHDVYDNNNHAIWVEAVAAAIRCQEQSAAAGDAFVAWVKREKGSQPEDENPAAELLKDVDLTLTPPTEGYAAVLDQLNREAWFEGVGWTALVPLNILPGDDVANVALLTTEELLERYRAGCGGRRGGWRWRVRWRRSPLRSGGAGRRGRSL